MCTIGIQLSIKDEITGIMSAAQWVTLTPDFQPLCIMIYPTSGYSMTQLPTQISLTVTGVAGASVSETVDFPLPSRKG